jgi:deoxyribonuclease-1
MKTRLVAVLIATMWCVPLLVAADQTQIKDYEAARHLFWSVLYSKGGETLYCGQPFSTRHRRGVNIEHVFPMSWATRTLNCGRRKQCRETNLRFNRLEADLHNLYPARTDINDTRASFRFGDVGGERRDFGRCDFEIDERRRVVEPRPASRGEIARAMFYMHTEYGMKIFARLGRTLQRWHRQDPPSKHEQYRNDVIERLQGTRNPYIDRPDRANELRFAK